MESSSPSREELTAELVRLNAEIAELMREMGSEPSDLDYLEFRAAIGRVQAEFDSAINQLGALLGMGSAKARILALLQLRVGRVVTKDELAGVSGIVDFQRRIRELRQDDGYEISSMESHPGLRPGEYMLLSRHR